MPNQKSKDFARQARPMGHYRHLQPRPSGLEPEARQLALRTITQRATALLVEVDGLLSEVEDFVFYHHETWQLGREGQIYARNMEKLREWRDFIVEIGEDSLTWE